jgi:hypothetical protein
MGWGRAQLSRRRCRPGHIARRGRLVRAGHLLRDRLALPVDGADQIPIPPVRLGVGDHHHGPQRGREPPDDCTLEGEAEDGLEDPAAEEDRQGREENRQEEHEAGFPARTARARASDQRPGPGSTMLGPEVTESDNPVRRPSPATMPGGAISAKGRGGVKGPD